MKKNFFLIFIKDMLRERKVGGREIETETETETKIEKHPSVASVHAPVL